MADINYFEVLNSVDCTKFVEKKNNLTYLSWSFAWQELKKRFPESFYTIYENVQGWNYFTDGKTCWVKTGVTVNGLEHIEYLPVMDYKNRSIPLDIVTSFDVNKAIQRSLTKAVARHGLGLYIYAGEDLPSEPKYICDNCGSLVLDYGGQSAEAIAKATKQKYGRYICMTCINKKKEATKAVEQIEALPITEVHE